MSNSGSDSEDEKHEEEETPKQQTNLTGKQRKKMRRAAEKAAQLASGTTAAAPAVLMNTHSQPLVVSAISTAQHKAFGFLKLEEVGPEDRRKARTHANPLAKQYLEPTPAPTSFSEWYEDPNKPLGIDIGCAAGRFAFMMSCHENSKFPDVNHLGLEIRRALVERANTWAEGKQLNRKMKFVLSSANVSLTSAVKGYPGKVAFLCVQFPDPHFKRKHHKRRVVDNAFIEMVAELLDEGAWFFVQSDVEEAAAQMRDRIDAFPQYFRRDGEYTPRDSALDVERVRSGEGEEFWTRDGKRALESAAGLPDYGDWRIGPNPMGVPTEREVQNEALGLPIYRALFVRTKKQE